MGIASGAAAADGRGEFGELVRSQRIATGLTQEELAEQSGLSTRTISDIERGRIGRPHRRSVELLCKALGITDSDRGGHLPVAARQPQPAVEHAGGRVEELKILDGLLDGADGPAGTTTHRP